MAPVIVSASNALLQDRDGREYIDLSMGYGTVWLGHGHPAVVGALTTQLQGYAAPGYLPTGGFEAAQRAVAGFLPERHFLGGLYSTGMEAVEAALRAAWAHTGRIDIAGFEGSEHGRSFVASALGGAPQHGNPTFVHRLPALSAPVEQIEAELKRLSARVKLAAIVVEPIQMTGGGHEIARQTCELLFALAREEGIAVIFDEALTGLHRCGARLFCDLAGQVPDVLVLGKGMGNGFPCAAVSLRSGFTWDRGRVRPGSTFWNHPLACAAATATLTELAHIQPAEKVRAIESIVRETLGKHELRGRGAMWCLGFPDARRQPEFAARILGAGVVTSYYDRYIRLLPPLTIEPATLRRGCEAIGKAYADTFG
jgi:acetylornithine/succinyldiaminopimelate/putrescine aminotransferase